jgi:hypothetical protein
MKTLMMAVAAMLIAIPALAGEIPPDVQVKLQSAMQTHLDEITEDGAYRYLTAKADVETLYPANTHPMILPFGEDYFVCSDMVDAAGQSFTADFLVREIAGDYRVVQMLVDQRKIVEKAMGKGE